MVTGRTGGTRNRSVGNEDRLIALGDAIDRRSGVTRKSPRGTKRTSKRGRNSTLRRRIIVVLLVVAVIGTGFAGTSYWLARSQFERINNLTCGAACLPTIGDEPFNILSVGSDSRTGLKGEAAAQAGVVAGQRSDVVKVIHVDPGTQKITVISIPRDTMVSLLENTGLYSKFNRINVNYGSGPQLLARTITANFGIPINHIVEVSFGGLANSVVALGGLYMNFPYRARDAYSGLRINSSGCQHIDGNTSLAVARSRHFEWFQNGHWYYDGTSDYGRIHRQDAFLRAMILRARQEYNPDTILNVLGKLPEGITIDSSFTLNNVIALAVKFHNFDPNQMVTYTLPTISPGHVGNYGSVLVVNQPATQQLLVNVFGSSLVKPTNPPPNAQLQTPQPPFVPLPTTTTTVKPTGTTTKHPVTTTTQPTNDAYYFNPTPCFPSQATK